MVHFHRNIFSNKFFLHPQKGHRVFVYGIPKGDFSVNFIGATGDWLFHLNPRFSEKKVCELQISQIHLFFCCQVVRGSQKNGIWGEEEREGKFPLSKGQAVDIALHNEPYSIQAGEFPTKGINTNWNISGVHQWGALLLVCSPG